VASRPAEFAQTLDRGLQVLDALRDAPEGLTVLALSNLLGISRSIVYRLVATLAARRMVVDVGQGVFRLGPHLVELAAVVEPQLQRASAEVLRRLARETGNAAHVSIADGDDVVALASAEPPGTGFHIVWRVGHRHPMNRGASGLAILSARPPDPGEPAEVELCRNRGWAVSRGHWQAGTVGVAAPISSALWPLEASVGVITIGEPDLLALGEYVVAAARDIASALDDAAGL